MSIQEGPAPPSGNIPPRAEGTGKWMALTAALLGWMFDGLEMGLVPLAARPAFKELLGSGADAGGISLWYSVATAAFLIGAATGGVLFGWLGDRVGRVRAMMISVLTYALFSGACGFATSAGQITAFRFLSALGMGGEWSLGVALVMEIWPDRSRAFLAGVIGAAANVGFLLIGVLDFAFISRYMGAEGWRWLFFIGAMPALLTFFIRLFVPESARWEEERAKGTTSHWATRDLLGVLVGAAAACSIIYLWAAKFSLPTRILGTIPALAVVAAGYVYPVLRYVHRVKAADSGAEAASWLSQIVGAKFFARSEGAGGQFQDRPPPAAPPGNTGISAHPGSPPLSPNPTSGTPTLTSDGLRAGHPLAGTIPRMLFGACLGGVALLGTWAAIQQAPSWAGKLTEGTDMADLGRSLTQILAGVGAVFGTIGAALMGGWLGRRITYTILCLASLGAALLFYQGNTTFGPFFLVTVFLAGGISASFYGWLPLYLPELFRTRVRATGQGFSFNFGRVIAAIGTLQGGYLINEVYKGDYRTVCSVMSLIYVVGLLIIWLGPETKGKPLPE
jgi:SHS family sialic acid transporter-like MFS transporter